MPQGSPSTLALRVRAGFARLCVARAHERLCVLALSVARLCVARAHERLCVLAPSVFSLRERELFVWWSMPRPRHRHPAVRRRRSAGRAAPRAYRTVALTCHRSSFARKGSALVTGNGAWRGRGPAMHSDLMLVFWVLTDRPDQTGINCVQERTQERAPAAAAAETQQ